MANYSVEGKLGTGKTKFAVWMAQQALIAGRRVASNVDLNLPMLMPRRGGQYVRIPDKPTAEDLEFVGPGNPDSYDEERNGVMLLDELGTWLNSRSFQDKGRAALLDWLIHARKHGWDVYLIVQDAQMIDRQVREALIEYSARCMRLDRVKIPLVSPILGTLGDVVAAVLPASWAAALHTHRWGFLPRMHLVTARLGSGPNAVVAQRWTYRGDDLHAAYDTRQIFRADYPHGTYTVRWVPEPRSTWLQRWQAWLAGPPRPALKPKRPEVQALAGMPPDAAIRAAARLARLAG
jgi:hypothetical protein